MALLGPRQVGKTTLAHLLSEKRDTIYLDLESQGDLNKLSDPELYLSSHADRLVILDEVQRNVGKRLVKSPKLYIRDSGLTHCLLRIPDKEALLGHPVAGASWEGWIVENIISLAPDGSECFFYRTAAGAETDLILTLPSGEIWALEVKRGLTPTVARGFYNACDDVKATRRFVVYSGSERYPLSANVEAVGVAEIAALVAAAK
ncbi:hypothetical protein BH23VER1_BH23VER1_09320 [soil metagenome]